MAQKSQTKPDLLQKPLYIFDLPEELLLSLSLKSNQINHEPEAASPVPVEERYVKHEDGTFESFHDNFASILAVSTLT